MVDDANDLDDGATMAGTILTAAIGEPSDAVELETVESKGKAEVLANEFG